MLNMHRSNRVQGVLASYEGRWCQCRLHMKHYL